MGDRLRLVQVHTEQHCIDVFLPKRTNLLHTLPSLTPTHYVIIGILQIIAVKWEVAPPVSGGKSSFGLWTDGSTSYFNFIDK